MTTHPFWTRFEGSPLAMARERRAADQEAALRALDKAGVEIEGVHALAEAW